MKLEGELLTVRETSKILRVHPNRVYELIREGTIPHLRLGRKLLVPSTRLVEWMQKETVSPDG